MTCSTVSPKKVIMILPKSFSYPSVFSFFIAEIVQGLRISSARFVSVSLKMSCQVKLRRFWKIDTFIMHLRNLIETYYSNSIFQKNTRILIGFPSHPLFSGNKTIRSPDQLHPNFWWCMMMVWMVSPKGHASAGRCLPGASASASTKSFPTKKKGWGETRDAFLIQDFETMVLYPLFTNPSCMIGSNLWD